MDRVRVGAEVGYTVNVGEETARRVFDEILYRYTRILQDIWMAREKPPEAVLRELVRAAALAAIGARHAGVMDFNVAGWKDGKLAAVVGYKAWTAFAGVEYRLPVRLPDVYPAMICRAGSCVGYGPLNLASDAVKFAQATEGLFVRVSGRESMRALWELYQRLLSGDTSVLRVVDTVAVYDRKSGKIYVLRRSDYGTMIVEYLSGRSHTVPYSLEETYRMMTRGMRSIYALA